MYFPAEVIDNTYAVALISLQLNANAWRGHGAITFPNASNYLYYKELQAMLIADKGMALDGDSLFHLKGEGSGEEGLKSELLENSNPV